MALFGRHPGRVCEGGWRMVPVGVLRMLALAEHALTDALSSGYNSVAQMFFSQEKELYMRREERNEPQYIAPIGTVPSIPSRGSLSHKLADQLPHESVALQEVQDRRTHQRVPGPGDRTLHDYANVSLSARNPLRYKRNDAHTEICVLRISPTSLDLNGVIITARNAAAPGAIFRPATTGLFPLDRAHVFAEDWRHPGDP